MPHLPTQISLSLSLSPCFMKGICSHLSQGPRDNQAELNHRCVPRQQLLFCSACFCLHVQFDDTRSILPGSLPDIIHSGEALHVKEEISLPPQGAHGAVAFFFTSSHSHKHKTHATHMPHTCHTQTNTHTCAPAGTCVRCGYMTSSDLCKACVLLEGLNKGQPKLAVGKKQHEVGWSVFLSLTCRINKLAPHFAFFFCFVCVCVFGWVFSFLFSFFLCSVCLPLHS